EGEIADFTREISSTNYIDVTINPATFSPDLLKGTFIYIENDGEWNASYKILGVTQLELRKFRLDIGDITLIRRYRSQEDPEQGFIYDLVPGAAFRIPLSHFD
ncbi:MAG: bacterial Ig-like protein, partial [Paenibacillus sp.]|nr:bacterial Ig-like protein [Paenibacillus sp.]